MVLAVCVLGMVLVLLSERVSRKPEPAEVAISAPASARADNDSGFASPNVAGPADDAPVVEAPARQMEINAERRDEALATESLAPPLEAPSVPQASASLALKEEAAEVQLQPEAPAAVPSTPVIPAPESPQAKSSPPVAETPRQAVSRPKPASPQPQKPGAITNFVVFARDNGATVRLGASSPINYKSMTLDNPHRVVIDLDGDWQFPPNLAVPKNEIVNSVRVGKMDGKTRVVVDLKQKPRLSRVLAAKTGYGLDLRLDK